MRIVPFFFLSFSFWATFSPLSKEKKSQKKEDHTVCIVPVTVSTASPGSAV